MQRIVCFNRITQIILQIRVCSLLTLLCVCVLETMESPRECTMNTKQFKSMYIEKMIAQYESAELVYRTWAVQQLSLKLK